MTRLITTLLISTMVLYGCGAETEPDPVSESEPAPESSLKLYVFDCGALRFDTVELFSIPEDETDIRELIVPCYVIEHEKGRLLWDGGLKSSVADVEGWHEVDGSDMRLDRTLADQLVELDLDLSSFDYAAFSHMHYDHVGVANELQGATLIIQRREYEAAFAEPVTVEFFDPSYYDKLKDAETLVIEGDHDVFGDGSVQILSAPGHTPGHQVLFIDLPNTGPLVLSGDLYHFRVSREKRYVPQFNFDAPKTLESMDRIEAFVAEKGATFWIEHDLALFESLKQAPLFYD